MADGDVHYEYKSVRMISSRKQGNSVEEWQADGWELVSLSDGRVWTKMTFRRAEPKSRRRMLAAGTVVTFLVIIGIVAATTSVPAKVEEAFCRITDAKCPTDSDRDGIPDQVEVSGWRTQAGTVYRTSPDNPDTDGDGLTDGEEASKPIKDAKSEGVYSGYSNPRRPDTDKDGLGDADEADSSVNPLDRDSDKDGLADGIEVEVVGSAPDAADTDGDGYDDGFEDANRKSKGLDPLWVDIKVRKLAYATDFAKGVLLGDLNREDSLAWLVGNLSAGATTFIPVIGSLVGGLADIRDAVGSAIRGDWVGSGFSAVGALPGGDVVAIPGKAGKFVARNPELAATAAAVIVTLSKVPEKIKVNAAKRVWRNWDELKAAGVSDTALLQLQKGRTNLDDLAAAIKRNTPVAAPGAKFFANGPEGEKFLEHLYGVNVVGATKQISASTKGCLKVCNDFRRRFDVLADGVAHESKVGFVRMSPSIERQIRSDAWLVKNGDIEGAHWHFFASARSNTLSADKKVLDLLDEQRIPYTIHPPK